jgi:hypothetical protein
MRPLAGSAALCAPASAGTGSSMGRSTAPSCTLAPDTSVAAADAPRKATGAAAPTSLVAHRRAGCSEAATRSMPQAAAPAAASRPDPHAAGSSASVAPTVSSPTLDPPSRDLEICCSAAIRAVAGAAEDGLGATDSVASALPPRRTTSDSASSAPGCAAAVDIACALLLACHCTR